LDISSAQQVDDDDFGTGFSAVDGHNLQIEEENQ
jgi:hypothetical protein